MATKVQSVLFCFVFIALLAHTECNEKDISATSSNNSNAAENLEVKGDFGGIKLTFCSEDCSATQGVECWCCAFNKECWPTHEECKQVCDPKLLKNG